MTQPESPGDGRHAPLPPELRTNSCESALPDPLEAQSSAKTVDGSLPERRSAPVLNEKYGPPQCQKLVRWADLVLLSPSPGGGGSARIVRCETGWGDGLNLRSVLSRETFTPPRRSPDDASHRRVRVDPPPPGEGKQTHPRILAARCARGFANRLPPGNRGRREDRVRAAPAVSCAICTKENAHEHTGEAEASGFPCAVVSTGL